MQQDVMVPLLHQRDLSGAVEAGVLALVEAIFESAPTTTTKQQGGLSAIARVSMVLVEERYLRRKKATATSMTESFDGMVTPRTNETMIHLFSSLG